MCREGLTGRCYWEVEWRGQCCYRSDIQRNHKERKWVLTAGLEGTTSPGVFIVMMMVVYTVCYNGSSTHHLSPLPCLHQSRSVSGPACWLSVLLQSVPRCRRVLTHTDTHPHLLDHIHPGGPPPWVLGSMVLVPQCLCVGCSS